MKSLACLLLLSFGLFVPSAIGQQKYPALVTFRIVDDAGVSVTRGDITVSTFSHWQPGDGFGRDLNDQFQGSVGNDGKLTLEVPNIRGRISYGVKPDGKYYPVAMQSYRFDKVNNGRWEPWNPEITVTVPRVINPIPLYARKIRATELPVIGPIGFDLMVSDWVAPHGKGKTADFICEVATLVPMSDPNDAFESVLTITFPNPGDGFHPRIARPNQRLLDLPRQAPENDYEPRLTRRIKRATQGAVLETDSRDDQNYFFRVRTTLDPSGQVTSALYGKVHGDINWDTLNSPSGHLQFTYYLNPTSLDRNLEFDPKRNLFSARIDGTNVTEP